MTSGSSAPAANASAEATAASSGRARVRSVMPSSSRACAPSASCAASLRRDLLGQLARQPALHVDAHQLPVLGFGRRRQLLALARQVGALAVRLRTDRHVLAGAIDSAPPTRPAMPVMQHAGGAEVRGRHAHHEARRRNQAVVGAEHGGTQPADALDRDGTLDDEISLVAPSLPFDVTRQRARPCGSSMRPVRSRHHGHSTRTRPKRATVSPTRQTLQARRQVDVVCDQQRLAADLADDEALMPRSVAIVGQHALILALVTEQSSPAVALDLRMPVAARSLGRHPEPPCAAEPASDRPPTGRCPQRRPNAPRQPATTASDSNFFARIVRQNAGSGGLPRSLPCRMRQELMTAKQGLISHILPRRFRAPVIAYQVSSEQGPASERFSHYIAGHAGPVLLPWQCLRSRRATQRGAG